MLVDGRLAAGNQLRDDREAIAGGGLGKDRPVFPSFEVVGLLWDHDGLWLDFHAHTPFLGCGIREPSIRMGHTAPSSCFRPWGRRPTGFVKLLRLRLASGKQVPLPGPTHPLGSPFRARNFGPLLESIAHRFAVL